jgi:hypothetical protein
MGIRNNAIITISLLNGLYIFTWDYCFEFYVAFATNQDFKQAVAAGTIATTSGTISENPHDLHVQNPQHSQETEK